MNRKEVDVIIPVYRPDEKLSLLLHRLQEQTCVVHRVIIMNTGKEYWKPFWETYRIEELEHTLSIEVHHLTKEEFDHGGTRKQAVSYSTAPYFICMTQDAVPADERLVEQLLQALEQKTTDGSPCAAAYARQLPDAGCSLMERYVRQFNYPETGRVKEKSDIPKLGIKTYFCSNVCAVYDRSIFEQLGGFETHTIFNEDMIYAGHAVTAGYGIAYAAQAQVIHSHNYTAIQQKKRYFDLGVSQAEHPEVFANVKSESEGMKMVTQTAKYLLRHGKPFALFSLVAQNAAKLSGYKLGLNYKNLSKEQILKYTMSPDYWKDY